MGVLNLLLNLPWVSPNFFNGCPELTDDSDDSLDARFEYQFDRWNGTWRVFVAGLDLLKGTEDPDTLGYLGESKYYNSGTYFGGRSIAVGFSSVF